MFGWRQEGKVGMEEDGWEGKREVEAMVVDGVVEEEAVEKAMEKEQMGIRTKNSWGERPSWIRVR